MVNGEIKEIEKEIKEKKKLNEIYYEFFDARVVEMRLSVDEKGDVYIEYTKYYKKSL
jgi:hypothetical protein